MRYFVKGYLRSHIKF